MKINFKRFNVPYTLMCISAVAMFFGCSKSPNEPVIPITFNQSVLKSNSSANAGAAFDGFVNSFIVKDSNGQTYVVDGLQKRDRAYFWGQAFMITGLIDGYERVPNSTRKQLVIDLVNSFLNNETYDWSWNSWTDDIAWSCIAVMRAYIAVGDANYLKVAKTNWDFCYHRGWDNALGGGMWENMDKHTKAALANGPMIISGMLIYQATGDVWYLDRCKEIYSWYRSKLFDPNTGIVNEAMVNDGTIQYSDHPYNTGSFINSAATLYKATKSANYLSDAQKAADHVMSKFPVLTEEGDGAVRGIAKLARENGLEWKYYPWLITQCENAWNNRNTSRNITNNNFTTITGGGEQFAMNCISAVTVQQVTPEQYIPSGATFSIISKSSGKAVDIKGGTTTNGDSIIQWTDSRANNQRWVISYLGGYTYKIISVSSGKSLDVKGGSAVNGAIIDQWDYSGGNNQKWYIFADAQGYYSITSVNSLKRFDVAGGSVANGAKIVQWEFTGGDNQRFGLVQ